VQTRLLDTTVLFCQLISVEEIVFFVFVFFMMCSFINDNNSPVIFSVDLVLTARSFQMPLPLVVCSQYL